MLHPGLYEQIINQQLTDELGKIPAACKSVAPIDKAEASKVLAQYLPDVVQKGRDYLLDNGGDISSHIELTNKIVSYVQHEGSRPMNITWRLDRPIPAKFLKKTNKLVVG